MQMSMNLGAVQTVTPQMIAFMTVLQCSSQELGDYLTEMSYENPLMDLKEPQQEPPMPEEPLLDRLRWLRSSDRQNRSYYTDADRDSVDQYLPAPQNMCLSDFVREQIVTLKASPELRAAMETVAELLDDRGLYDGPVQEIARISGCGEEIAAEALELVRALEPAGVAAKCVKDALLCQLRQTEPEKPLAKRLLLEHFGHLSSWSSQRIAKAMGVSEEAVQAAKQDIALLNPYPSNGFAGQGSIRYVTPDLRIYDSEEGLTVVEENPYLPTVSINSDYLDLLQATQDQEIRRYLTQKLAQLEQVMENLSRRRSTVLRCGEIIAKRQKPFFYGGTLEKMTLRDVAMELEVHESTVSRAVRNKYLQCERGIFPMSAFFSRDVGQNVGLSRSHIQKVLQSIIAAEDPEKPLSDEKIVSALADRHIALSRRAVAKYRMELGILPASARKRRRG